MSYNEREKVLPRSEVPVITMEKFEVRQILDKSGISHSSLVKSDPVGVLDLPFHSFSMESFSATGEVSRLQFNYPKHIDSLDIFDRVSGDLSEISAKFDHMQLMAEVSSSENDKSEQ